jgi:hypothetical protein
MTFLIVLSVYAILFYNVTLRLGAKQHQRRKQRAQLQREQELAARTSVQVTTAFGETYDQEQFYFGT